MTQTSLRLQPSETAVFHGATRIYAAYISQGRVTEGSEDQWMARSMREAIRLALTADEAIQSDDELAQRDPVEF